MAIEDGYFLAKELNGIDAFDTDALSAALQRFEDFRKEHTTAVKEQAYFTGKIFHHIPAFLRPLRDFIFDRTPFLQRNQGDGTMQQTLKQMEFIDDGTAITQSSR